jgi:DNA-binding PadR family transcriptional regulator
VLTVLGKLFRGFIKIHILHHAEEGPVYGLRMAEELARHGYDNLSPGTLYPALHSLERAGCLSPERRLAGGRWLKYYTLTPARIALLQQVRTRLRELADEVLETAETRG